MRILLFFVALLIAGPAAAGCRCSVIPDEGVYRAMGSDVRLTYLNNEAEECPTEINLRANPPNRPPVNVNLQCLGDSFEGAETTRVGTFVWRISGQSGHQGLLQAGIASAETLTMTLEVPAELKAVGKADRQTVLERTGGGRAAECICRRVRDELEWAEAIRDAYADKKALARAKATAMRGNNSKQSFYLDNNGVLHKFDEGTAGELSYLEDAETRTGEALEKKWAAEGEFVAVKNQGNTAPAQSGSLNEVQSGASASTDPVACKVNMPTLARVRANCTPAIVLNAFSSHENVHAATCRKMNNRPIDTWDGYTIQLKPRAEIRGFAAPSSNYDAYMQSPANLAADEVAAYTAEIGVYTEFIKKRCDG
ncbi:hypothetical protein [Roseovarius pelagicus]|uniref:hypothetical protein n=1 Tax=Roseovarius pelagicus TaxID=2980108 RepID=UPI0021D68C59|nr:hypothetical protein [Roseovarius pelagicus]